MSSQKIKFGDKEVDKVDLSKTVVSSRWKLNDIQHINIFADI